MPTRAKGRGASAISAMMVRILGNRLGFCVTMVQFLFNVCNKRNRPCRFFSFFSWQHHLLQPEYLVTPPTRRKPFRPHMSPNAMIAELERMRAENTRMKAQLYKTRDIMKKSAARDSRFKAAIYKTMICKPSRANILKLFVLWTKEPATGSFASPSFSRRRRTTRIRWTVSSRIRGRCP